MHRKYLRFDKWLVGCIRASVAIPNIFLCKMFKIQRDCKVTVRCLFVCPRQNKGFSSFQIFCQSVTTSKDILSVSNTSKDILSVSNTYY